MKKSTLYSGIAVVGGLILGGITQAHAAPAVGRAVESKGRVVEFKDREAKEGKGNKGAIATLQEGPKFDAIAERYSKTAGKHNVGAGEVTGPGLLSGIRGMEAYYAKVGAKDAIYPEALKAVATRIPDMKGVLAEAWNREADLTPTQLQVLKALTGAVARFSVVESKSSTAAQAEVRANLMAAFGKLARLAEGCLTGSSTLGESQQLRVAVILNKIAEEKEGSLAFSTLAAIKQTYKMSDTDAMEQVKKVANCKE